MAKVTYRDAKEDDPIYKEGFYVSSHNYSREYVKSKKDTNLTEPKQKKSEDKDSTDD
jgi:hypothetical protein